MITDIVLNVLKAPFLWLLEVLPSFTWPTWFSASGDMGSAATSVGTAIGAVGNWIPVPQLVLIITLIGAAWLFSIAVHGLRFVVSLFTGGGGNVG